MLLTLQSFVRQRFFPLIMSMLAVGFLLLLRELIGYKYFEVSNGWLQEPLSSVC